MSEHKQDQGMVIGTNAGCSSTYMLVSLTPNTMDNGFWNAKGSNSHLDIKVSAEKIDSTRPLLPTTDWLGTIGRQLKIDAYNVALPGQEAIVEGSLYMKAASAAVVSLAALTLF